jgi:hypothetical protein
MSPDPLAEEITITGQVASALVVRSDQPVAHLLYFEGNKSFTALPQQGVGSM